MTPNFKCGYCGDVLSPANDFNAHLGQCARRLADKLKEEQKHRQQERDHWLRELDQMRAERDAEIAVRNDQIHNLMDQRDEVKARAELYVKDAEMERQRHFESMRRKQIEADSLRADVEMLNEQKHALELARAWAWGMIEEGYRLLASLYRKGSYDERRYTEDVRHPRMCREAAQREVARLLSEEGKT